MEDESEYEKFVISENQVSTFGLEPSSEQTTPSLSELDKITRMIVRRVLSQSPFPTKYEDVRLIVKHYLPDLTTHNIFNSLIENAKNTLSRIFGLSLEDVKYGQGKRDLFLKQTISFKAHDLKTLSQGDHELRGFILLLVPCFKAHNNEISLKFLCEVFEKIGKTHMIPTSKDDEEDLVMKLKTVKRKKDVKYNSKDFAHISDYLLYAKDLSYLYITFQSQVLDLLSSVTILPGYRFNIEYNKDEYVSEFKALDEAAFNRGLDIFFE
ncbi:hypothetical protein MACJ_002184 [Theileria orientalis]|uniref:Uncharacterized protein n=1 Tax=Theileria orientalis TaxID=68886 RepID=A0A976M5S9_THEOR|nr:hypothetical protein MACJ_002184 [Theileria orientalis]